MSVSVAGALRWHDSKLDGFLRDRESRRVLTASEVREVLLAELEKGHKVIPWGNCPTFDFKEGCPGHVEPNVLELTPEPAVVGELEEKGRAVK